MVSVVDQGAVRVVDGCLTAQAGHAVCSHRVVGQEALCAAEGGLTEIPESPRCLPPAAEAEGLVPARAAVRAGNTSQIVVPVRAALRGIAGEHEFLKGPIGVPG